MSSWFLGLWPWEPSWSRKRSVSFEMWSPKRGFKIRDMTAEPGLLLRNLISEARSCGFESWSWKGDTRLGAHFHALKITLLSPVSEITMCPKVRVPRNSFGIILNLSFEMNSASGWPQKPTHLGSYIRTMAKDGPVNDEVKIISNFQCGRDPTTQVTTTQSSFHLFSECNVSES